MSYQVSNFFNIEFLCFHGFLFFFSWYIVYILRIAFCFKCSFCFSDSIVVWVKNLSCGWVDLRWGFFVFLFLVFKVILCAIFKTLGLAL